MIQEIRPGHRLLDWSLRFGKTVVAAIAGNAQKRHNFQTLIVDGQKNLMEQNDDLKLIKSALEMAGKISLRHSQRNIETSRKDNGDPVTQADLEIDQALKDCLCRGDDGWLSEETKDDKTRLKKQRVWIVDPLDGTREFIEQIPEWSISIAMCINGRIEAAGIFNPLQEQLFLGSRETGVTLNDSKAKVSDVDKLENARILASRSEIKRGQWERFADSPFEVIPCGSVAYKLACASAGLADATFTVVPKNEWDIAAGTLLVEAAGGKVTDLANNEVSFNRPQTLVPNLIGAPPELHKLLTDLIKTQDEN